MAETGSLTIAWLDDPARARELARFFADNADAAYISHSELQGPRALDVGAWNPDLVNVVAEEIAERADTARSFRAPGEPVNPVLVAHSGGRLAGLAFVSFFREAMNPYVVVEDIIVDSASRGEGLGHGIMAFIDGEARKAGCKRLFLESGLGNDKAHHFFERLGFHQTSIVMMKKL